MNTEDPEADGSAFEPAERTPLRDELAEIRRRCASLPVVDDRSADKILGYDEGELPN
ncbi:hypothetical protein BH11ACT6_BH11ACT6_41120 [soil metagenome]